VRRASACCHRTLARWGHTRLWWGDADPNSVACGGSCASCDADPVCALMCVVGGREQIDASAFCLQERDARPSGDARVGLGPPACSMARQCCAAADRVAARSPTWQAHVPVSRMSWLGRELHFVGCEPQHARLALRPSMRPPAWHQSGPTLCAHALPHGLSLGPVPGGALAVGP
jgi:hypothetical protein